MTRTTHQSTPSKSAPGHVIMSPRTRSLLLPMLSPAKKIIETHDEDDEDDAKEVLQWDASRLSH